MPGQRKHPGGEGGGQDPIPHGAGRPLRGGRKPPPRSRAPSDRFQQDFTEHPYGPRKKSQGGTLPEAASLPLPGQGPLCLHPPPQAPVSLSHPPPTGSLHGESLMGQGAWPRTSGKDRVGVPSGPQRAEAPGPSLLLLVHLPPLAPRQSTEVVSNKGYQDLHCAQRWGGGRVRGVWLGV